MGKIKLQKVVGNLRDKFRKLYMEGTVIQKFTSVPQAIENFYSIFASQNRYFTENSRWVPLMRLSLQVNLLTMVTDN